MPAAMIEVRRPYSREDEIRIMEAVHGAMMEGLKIPAWDRNIRLLVHESHRFMTPPDKGERYTLISIDLFEGRSVAAKRALYQAIVERLEPLGIPRNDVKVLLRETGRENWGVRGGVPASEVDLGFEVEV